LPRSLTIPDVMTIATLVDVRTLLKHLPKESRARSTWRYVADRLEEAANRRRHNRCRYTAHAGAVDGGRDVQGGKGFRALGHGLSDLDNGFI
jgi:hypothetical protein